MKTLAARLLVAAACLSPALASAQDKPASAASAYRAWQHAGTLTILTTPEGANLPATATVADFPLLVRLRQDWFDFKQAKAKGEDLRFSSGTGAALAYQIEDWDPAHGTASVWVRIPNIKGNALQPLTMHWGKADAASESNGKAVFDEANGYLSVWHMTDPVRDEVGTLESKDSGTTPTAGMVGSARHFAGKVGVACGEKIANYPAADSPHSTEAWFRAEQPNATLIGWGVEGGNGSKVRMQFRSPPHVHIDSAFSDVNAESTLPLGEWIHVMHTYSSGDGKLYINGKLDGCAKPLLKIRTPARMSLGGWYNNYDFIGDLDEVRVSNVARSADWVRLQYENQKPMQTLVGQVVQTGNAFGVAPAAGTLLEGRSATFTAQAGGALKLYWTLKRDGKETPVATDCFAFTFDAGRVTTDQVATLQFKAVYANEVKTRDIPLSIKEDIEEPVFTLKAPATWDGRTTIEVAPQITNKTAMAAKGAGDLKIDWSVADVAVIKQAAPGKLILTRAHNSGKMTVTATVSNGGKPASQSISIAVTEPKHDPWVARTPAKDEKPEDNQFYARDDNNEGTLYYNGALDEAADSVFLKVYADDKAYKGESAKPAADKSYAFAVKLKPGLVHYKLEFGTKTGGTEKLLHTVSNIVCGDAYLIDGQSNAVATSWGKDDFPETSEWIRSFGSMGRDPKTIRWGNAIRRAPADRLTVGYWPFDLAKRLVADQKIPICIINGAVGGTMLCEHLRNPADPTDLTTIYGRMLWRVQQAGLTHGIRGLLWHQGEADQGTLGPTGDYNYKAYHQYFVDLSAAWKQDYPNLLNYYIYQIWPNACTDPSANDMLREVQRTLPHLYSNMRIMSTLGIVPGSGCHYLPAGYEQFATLMCPLVEQDNYGLVPTKAITAPDLRKASFTSAAHDEIALEFAQDMAWNNGSASLFALDGLTGKVVSGTASGKTIKLKLSEASTAKTITYLIGKSRWEQGNLIYGSNGIAALTFCEVPLARSVGSLPTSQ